MSSVARRVLTGATLITLVVLLLLANRSLGAGLVPWGVALVLSVLGAREVARMRGYRDLRLSPGLELAALAAAVPAWLARDGFSGASAPYLLLLAAGPVAMLTAALSVPGGAARGRAALFALWAAAPLYGLVTVDRIWGVAGLATLVLLSKIGDIFGYFVGRAIGVRHPFPKLSPGKTVAGCVASLIAGMVVGGLLGAFDALPGAEAGVLEGVLLGLALNLAAQGGDLLESYVKRRGDVKDSSTLVGAAGGVLDVVDSLLLSLPVALLVWPVIL